MLYCVTSVVCPPRPKEQLPGSQVSLPLTSRPPRDSPPNYATGTQGKYSSFSLGATWVWGHSQHKCVTRNCIGTVSPIVSPHSARNIIRAGTVTLATNPLLSYSFNHLPYFNSPSFSYSYTLLQAKSAARLSVQLPPFQSHSATQHQVRDPCREPRYRIPLLFLFRAPVNSHLLDKKSSFKWNRKTFDISSMASNCNPRTNEILEGSRIWVNPVAGGNVFSMCLPIQRGGIFHKWNWRKQLLLWGHFVV